MSSIIGPSSGVAMRASACELLAISSSVTPGCRTAPSAADRIASAAWESPSASTRTTVSMRSGSIPRSRNSLMCIAASPSDRAKVGASGSSTRGMPPACWNRVSSSTSRPTASPIWRAVIRDPSSPSARRAGSSIGANDSRTSSIEMPCSSSQGISSARSARAEPERPSSRPEASRSKDGLMTPAVAGPPTGGPLRSGCSAPATSPRRRAGRRAAPRPEGSRRPASTAPRRRAGRLR